MNIEKTWKFEFIPTNEPRKNALIGERVIGSIGEMQAVGEPKKLVVTLKTDSGLLGYPPRNYEAEIIQTVGPSDSVNLKGKVISVKGDTIIIELSFYK